MNIKFCCMEFLGICNISIVINGCNSRIRCCCNNSRLCLHSTMDHIKISRTINSSLCYSDLHCIDNSSCSNTSIRNIFYNKIITIKIWIKSTISYKCSSVSTTSKLSEQRCIFSRRYYISSIMNKINLRELELFILFSIVWIYHNHNRNRIISASNRNNSNTCPNSIKFCT